MLLSSKPALVFAMLMSSIIAVSVLFLAPARPGCWLSSSSLEIVSTPWPLAWPAPVVLDYMLAELNAMFFECPVFEVSG